MFQTGYITIHAVEEYLPGQPLYQLGYPNREVMTSLNSALLPALGLDGQTALTNRLNLLALLRSVDLPGLRTLFTSFTHRSPTTGTATIRSRSTRATGRVCLTAISQPWGSIWLLKM